METTDFKIILLQRYCGEFRPATSETDATEMKTSEQIMADLRPMATYTPDEITAYLAVNGYPIGFDGDTPVWLMKRGNDQKLLD
jgi:hypothetical protein